MEEGLTRRRGDAGEGQEKRETNEVEETRDWEVW